MRTKIKKRKFTGTTQKEPLAREAAGRAIARRAAAEGIVLLRNEEHLLPLVPGSRVALYGSGVMETIKGGTGSGDVNVRESVSIYEGMKNAGFLVTDEEWCRNYVEEFQRARLAWREEMLLRFSSLRGEGNLTDLFDVYTGHPFARPVGDIPTEAAPDTETAFYVLSRVAGEGADRTEGEGDYTLLPKEEQMLAAVCRLYRNVAVVLNVGGVVDLSFLDRYNNIKGLLQLSQPGMEGGNAFADVVSGKVNPSGHLTDTWAYRYHDYPNAEEFSHCNGNTDQEFYNEGIYVGYRYFDSYRIPVRFGFGEGLSYTTFALQAAQPSLYEESPENQSITADQCGLEVSVSVTNSGDTAGREVVQVYLSLPQPYAGGSAVLEKERRRLAGYAKTSLLAPDAAETVTIRIPYSRMASYSEEEAGWIMEAGCYGLWVGDSLRNAVLTEVIRLEQTKILEYDSHVCLPASPVREYHRHSHLLKADVEELMKADVPVLQLKAATIPSRKIYYRTNAELADAEGGKFAAGLSEETLCSLVTGDPGRGQGAALGSAGNSVPGSAGETSLAAVGEGLASIVLADGPAGLRLTPSYEVEDGRILQKSFIASLENGLFDVQDEEKEDRPDRTVYYQYCTAFPVGTLLAQTWDQERVREAGTAAAAEMQTFGVTIWLAPGMCIHRNPLCGRNFEYYSEDPVLTGTMAAAITEGVQSVPGCGTAIKHFACNSQEDNRMGVDCILSERALREIYLKGFEIAVKTARPMSIMSSYNKINGVHSANNHGICTDVARNEWGFDGLIMTDWTTTMHGPDCTASGCMRAGNDLIMPGAESDQANLKKELECGRLRREDLEACVSRIYRIIQRSNRYED